MKIESRIRGALLGHLVGDAVGVPYEFRPADYIKSFGIETIDMVPPPDFDRAWFGISPGTYSDDGATMLAFTHALVSSPPIATNFKLLADNMLSWLQTGEFAVNNQVFDVGGTTYLGLQKYGVTRDPLNSGSSSFRHCGNGSLMRVLPLPLWASSIKRLVKHSHAQSCITHGHRIPQCCCAIWSVFTKLLLDRLIQGLSSDKRIVFDEALAKVRSFYEKRVDSEDWLSTLDQIESSPFRENPTGTGFVIDTMYSALNAVLTSFSYEETIREAIALGNDTDTTACIAGGVAGLLYGEDGIPVKWRQQLLGVGIWNPIIDAFISYYKEYRNPT
jgi:ADP-ribosylglycohydrolase